MALKISNNSHIHTHKNKQTIPNKIINRNMTWKAKYVLILIILLTFFYTFPNFKYNNIFSHFNFAQINRISKKEINNKNITNEVNFLMIGR